MKMKKYTVPLFALMLSLFLGACAASSGTASLQPDVEAGSEEREAAQQEASVSDSSDPETVYPVTLTDQLGRTVTIEKEPESIVSGYYISTGILLALDCEDKLTGIEAKADSRPIYHLSAPSVLKLPNVGTAKQFDLEGCAAINPDLIILPAKLKDTIPALEELGFTVLAVKPEDQTLLNDAVSLIGTAVNRTERANTLLAYTASNLTLLSEALADTETPTVYLAGNSSLLSTAGEAMYQNALIENAGGTNVASELADAYWSEISYEQLLAWDPAYIILAADASYSVESVLNDPNLAECNAIKTGQVYQFPNTIEAWDSPVPGSILGSLWLSSVLHPEQYPASQYEAAVSEFYETFYGFTPN